MKELKMSINPLTITFPREHIQESDAATVTHGPSREPLASEAKVQIKAELLGQIMGSGKSLAIHASIRLGILQKLKEEAVSLEKLSAELGLCSNPLKRLLRVLIQLKLVSLDSDRYASTELGKRLQVFAGGERSDVYQGKNWKKLLRASDALAANSLMEDIAKTLDPAQVPDEEKELYHLAAQYLWARVLYFAAELKIADAIAEGTHSTKALSTRLQVESAPLASLLNLLEQKNFVYNREGVWQLTEQGQELRISNPENVAHFLLVENHNRWMCLGMIDISIQTGKVVFEELFGNMFEFFRDNLQASREFDLGMDAITALETLEILKSGVFDNTREVVDIGGGRGLFLSSILGSYPRLHGVLFDLAAVTARENIIPKLHEEGYRERLRIEGGSFFDSVPKSSGTYCLKRVLHDWNDANAVAILRQIHKNMLPGGELLIIEPLLSPDDTRTLPVLIDLVMMPLFEGRERTVQEMEALLEIAGFAAVEVQKVGSFLTILKAKKKV
jgi:hypothetical protein